MMAIKPKVVISGTESKTNIILDFLLTIWWKIIPIIDEVPGRR